MADLEKKMVKEVKKDTLIVACRFKFPGKENSEILKLEKYFFLLVNLC